MTKKHGVMRFRIRIIRHQSIFPDKGIRAFIDKYFGITSSVSMVLPLDTKDRVIVSLPNGFNFTVNMQGEWINIDNHNLGWSALKEELISSEILKAVEENIRLPSLRSVVRSTNRKSNICWLMRAIKSIMCTRQQNL